MNKSQEIGRFGEETACLYLQRHGYAILDTNCKLQYAELDIVAQEGKTVVFVEVKTRTSRRYGDGSEAVEFYKQKSLRSAISAYLSRHHWWDRDVRADLIVVSVNRATKTVLIRHYKNVL